MIYLTAGVVVNPQRFCVGELVGITPKTIKNPIIIIPKPKITKPFLVPPRFFSNRGIVPNVSAKYQEKYTIDQPNQAIANPIMICLAIVFLKK